MVQNWGNDCARTFISISLAYMRRTVWCLFGRSMESCFNFMSKPDHPLRNQSSKGRTRWLKSRRTECILENKRRCPTLGRRVQMNQSHYIQSVIKSCCIVLSLFPLSPTIIDKLTIWSHEFKNSIYYGSWWKLWLNVIGFWYLAYISWMLIICVSSCW